MKAIDKKPAIEIYLAWVNDWLTLKAMAEYYHCSENKLYKKIIQGQKEHESKTR